MSRMDQAKHHPSKAKEWLPITPVILWRLREVWGSKATDPPTLSCGRLAALPFGFLWSGEITTPSLKATLHTDGAAGPSGLDAHAWRRLCTSFYSASSDLCHSLAKLAKRLCTNLVDPCGLSPFTACCLIVLDKDPGVRPIGICKTAWCTVSKAILHVIRDDIQEVTGSIQLCAGQTAGIEAAIQATRLRFSSEETEGVLLVDASNAFNSLNRQAALHNIQKLCPAIASILINTYRDSAQLFVDGCTLFSQKGITQFGWFLRLFTPSLHLAPFCHHLHQCALCFFVVGWVVLGV